MEKTKKQRVISGVHLTLNADVHEVRTERIIQFLLSATLFTGMAGLLNNILNLGSLNQTLAVGLTVISIEIMLLNRKSALVFVNAAFVAALLAAIIIWPDVILDGLRLLINRLFSASEMQQAYRYDMLDVTTPLTLHSRYMLIAFLITSAALALISVLISASRRKTLLIPIVLAATVAEIYFGVFPSPGWNIYLYFVFALAAACGGHIVSEEALRQGVVLLIMLLVVFGIVSAVWPSADKYLSDISERVRDRFDEQIEQPITLTAPEKKNPPPNQPKDVDLNVQKVTDNPYAKADSEEFEINNEQEFKGAVVGKANPRISLDLYGLILLALILATAVVWYIWNKIKAAKRQAGFLLPDCSAAINCMFVYIMDYLKAYGLTVNNAIYSIYSEPLCDMISPRYAEEYADAVNLWQEAVYSNHTMSKAQRTKMRFFLESTRKTVWNRSTYLGKLKIKLKYFL